MVARHTNTVITRY
uniref:Uncharacterized protein n=1 Tax=Panagrolaimus sp. JU765 TaxID=591449 RepID=A0AC34PXT4_9BILA